MNNATPSGIGHDGSNLVEGLRDKCYKLRGRKPAGVRSGCSNPSAFPARRMRHASTRPALANSMGMCRRWLQQETMPLYPHNPCAVTTLYAYWIVANYSEAYGILINHESSRRGETFITRKITRGHAKDYARMQWMRLQKDKPEVFIIATGVQYTVRPCYFRRAELDTLLGDANSAQTDLRWIQTLTPDNLAIEMIESNFCKTKHPSMLRLPGLATTKPQTQR